MILQCPVCKFYVIKVYSRRKYLINFGISLGFSLLGYLGLKSIINEQDVGPAIILGIGGYFLAMIVSLLFAIYYLFKAINIKESFNTCGYCKAKLSDDELIRIIGSDKESLLKTFTRLKRKN